MPGAPNPNAFWDLICNGERAIGPVPADRWELDEDAPKGTTQGGFLDSIDGCDWRSLRMLPREARHMDPQHRLLLELAWEALEDAGLPMEDVAGSRTGVFVGIQWSDFFSQLSRDWSKIDGYAMVGNPSMFAANRISYTFDLRGPSIAMDTGCTSSFSSLQSACESLWLGDCDRVLVGASEIILSPSVQMGMDRAGLLSRSGSSMPFDQSADGFLRGEGGGMLVLKRVSDLLPHERAYAQIAGVATRHAGANDWIMATSARAQSEAVTAACAQCDVDPSKLDYVELHAAGSPRGDPVEVEVLSNVIAGPDRAETPCLLGSVKANIGHLGPASGVAGLIKVAMGLHKNTLPRTIAPKTLISEIASETSGLALSETPQPWLGDTRSGLAGVTSLSLGGTSAHVVLRANDQSAAPSSDSQDTPYILALSAPSQDALDDTVQAYIDYLRSEQADRIENICFTAAIGRSHHEVRVAVTGRTTAELADALAASSNDASLDPLDAIAAQYMAGEPIDWSEISFGNGTITSLPLYAWQRQRMWPEWLDATCMGTPPQMQVAPVAAPKDTAPQPRILPPLDQVRLRTSEVLELAQDEIDAAKMLTEIGLDSLTASELSRRLSADFQIDIPIVELLRQPSISAIADMLETRLAQRSDTSPAYETSTLPQISFDRAALHEPFPLTDIQTAYWIGRTARDALGGVGCHYYQEFECDSLDFKRLEQSFQALIVRHDMLRAVVTSEGMQQILDNTPTYEIAQLDLRGEDSAETENGLESVRREMATTRFDPEVWPLFEVRATHQDDNRMRVHLSFDLITVDATSLSLLIREWETLYKDPSALKPLDISFRDYVLAEIAHKDTQDFKSDAAYWDARLDDIAPAPILPAEVPNSQTAATGEALARIRRKGYLSPKAWSNLRARAGARGLTPSSVLCSAFSEILGTWGGGDRFTLNLTYCSRRPVHPRMSEMIGDFTTTILLDVDRTPQTFAEKAAILQARLGADMDHAAVSGVEVLRRVRQSRPEDGLAVMPVVFTSLLGHGAVSGETLFSSNWLGDLIYGISQTPQVSLDHQAFEENGSLVLHWDAVEDLFPAGVLDDMFTAYIEMLEALAEPEAWDNALLEHVPARQLARNAAVNATEAEFPTGLLHAPFEQRAKDQPDALAVIDGDTRLTYGDLDQRSLALAHKIREADVAPHAPVAIVMKKGWAQIVAALAILRAGAAYVPIDAALPNARISYLLDNCDITVALSQSDVELPSTEAAEDKSILNLVVDTQPMPSSDMPPLDCGASLDGLAYTIFTSGSTGQPKGVMIAHGAARNTIED
ncbi:beta-ketoacyl synthase N-terminal-like domain-containing protein, partial [Planktotalea sp.]|uniref:beta-ketoacyl synthase N-terminal-like domain-containing protein n=1 Tax=Planktotalea sp. TaxID=2029877 RepID=UPI003298B1FB